MSRGLDIIIAGWQPEDLANLCVLLGIENNQPVPIIVNRIKWLYYSKSRAKAISTTRNIINHISSKILKKPFAAVDDSSIWETPSYDELLIGACNHLKAVEKDASPKEMELYISQAVIIAALQRMSPRQRCKVFSEQFNVQNLVESHNIQATSLKGPITAYSMLGLAQASGFGVYIASTTALGFLTHAVGVTLPFAFYTGMSTTIAFVIGPVGWLSAGIWGAWRLTEPKWKYLIPALIYISSTNSRRLLQTRSKLDSSKFGL